MTKFTVRWGDKNKSFAFYNTYNEQHNILREGYYSNYSTLHEYEADGKTIKSKTKYNLNGTPFVETEE